MSTVLVVNSGSSSIKFQLVDPTAHGRDSAIAVGLVERIGESEGDWSVRTADGEVGRHGPIADHADGLAKAFALLDEVGLGVADQDVVAVGHRVVHGGMLFHEPVVIDDEVLAQIVRLSSLAPLHNPANVTGIEVARRFLPDVPHVAVFDTAFFNGLPPEAAIYAIDKDVAARYRIRRYGFHGTSHSYVSEKVSRDLGRPYESLNQIVLHLGNGASASAIRGGRAVDTSMGMTPLGGLVMGTRSGDIDPGLVLHLGRAVGMSIDEIDELLNRRSGLKGLAGENDFRTLQEMIDAGDLDAKLAYDVYVYQLRRYVGAYMAVLGHVDVITFTGGVGENHVGIRRDSLAGLEGFGIEVDRDRNAERSAGSRIISTEASRTTVMVCPTNEELSIARAALALS